MPASVPPVEVATNTASMSGRWAGSSGPVMSKCAAGLAAFSYWLGHTSGRSPMSRRTSANRVSRYPPTSSGCSTITTSALAARMRASTAGSILGSTTATKP